MTILRAMRGRSDGRQARTSEERQPNDGASVWPAKPWHNEGQLEADSMDSATGWPDPAIAVGEDADGTGSCGAVAWRPWPGGREDSPPTMGGGDDMLGRSNAGGSPMGRMSSGGGWGGHSGGRGRRGGGRIGVPGVHAEKDDFFKNSIDMKIYSPMVYRISFFIKIVSCRSFNVRLRRSHHLVGR
jgi:hypothetical protein